MSYHFLEVSSPNALLKVRDKQIYLNLNDLGERRLPIEDTAAVIITSFNCSIHHSFFASSGRMNMPVLITCENYKPQSVLLPAIRATDTSLLRSDWSYDEKLKSILWQKTISAKIENQAEMLKVWGASPEEVAKVRGCSNMGPFHAREARAAKLYWSFWGKNLPKGFARKRRSGGLNSMLNYAYAVLVSVITQRLLAAGLDPVRGFGHRFRERTCALTYDIMET
ncbi:MAG: CRISPR-associated endonuclease Cas1 [Verrucomicrobia bacterium]|nr:CRISPR-associated endonuclease Cas1 [Verrucomicrobiota bacterium]